MTPSELAHKAIELRDEATQGEWAGDRRDGSVKYDIVAPIRSIRFRAVEVVG